MGQPKNHKKGTVVCNMKYIRTKDGIYYNQAYFYSHKEEIIKQADTIEELCDEFVIKIKTGYLITYYNKVLLTQDANKNGADVYGAIWTDKGLIYVAKMNEKGELELI